MRPVAILLLFACSTIVDAGNPRDACAAEPQLVELVRDFRAGVVSYRVTPFDTIVIKDGRKMHVDVSWCSRPRMRDEWRDLDEIQVTLLGAQGRQGISPADVADVVYWETQALEYVRRRVAEDGPTAPLEALLARLKSLNPTWQTRDREALEIEVWLKSSQVRFRRRADSPENLDAALKQLDALLRTHRGDNLVLAQFATIHAELGREALQRDEFRAARDHCRELERFVPDARPTKLLRQEMRGRVKQLLVDASVAERLGKAGDSQQALAAAELLADGDPLAAKELGPQQRHEALRIGCFESLPTSGLLPPRTELQRAVAALLYERLFESDGVSARYVRSPLVEAIEPKDNGLRIDVRLSEGVQFSDGQPFGASQVQASLKQADRTGIKAVRLLGSRQLSISVASHPQPLELLSVPIGAPPLADAAIAAGGADAAASRAPVGTGPFVLTSSGDPTHVARLVRNPRYQSSKSAEGSFQEVIFKRYEASSIEQAVADLQQGDLHVLFPVLASDLAKIPNAATAFSTRPLRRESVWILAVNHRHALLKQRDARRALLLAIPREQILRDVFPLDAKRGRHRVATGPFPPQSPAHDGAVALADADAVSAADLVRSLRMKSPDSFAKPLRLVFPANEPGAAAAMGKVQEAAAKVDLPLELAPASSEDYVERVLDRQDFELAYQRIDHDNSLYDLRDLFGLDPAHLERGGRNFMGYQDEHVWQLLIEASRGRTGLEVYKLQQQVHRRLNDQIAFVPLWWLEQFVVSTNRLCLRDADRREQPVAIDPLTLFQRPETWYLQPKPRGR